MAMILTSIRIVSLPGLLLFFVLWLVLFACAHLLVMFLRHGPLIGWAVSPWGVTVMYLYEPSTFHIWLNVLFPALVSAAVLYVGLFTSLAPITLPHYPLLDVVMIILGVMLTSTLDFMNALRDVRYPLWGEARILRSMQLLRATWASIHFTPFGLSYLHDRFGSNPRDLLQVL